MSHDFRIGFTSHAVERFIERVRPGIDVDVAVREMRAMAQVAEYSPGAPAWCTGVEEYEERTTGWLVLADIAFPLSGHGRKRTAVTCIVRGSIATVAREARNHERTRKAKHRDTLRHSNRAGKDGRDRRSVRRMLDQKDREASR